MRRKWLSDIYDLYEFKQDRTQERTRYTLRHAT
jgi:hypothetical protein